MKKCDLNKKQLRWNSKLVRHPLGGFSIDSFDESQWLSMGGVWHCYGDTAHRLHEAMLPTFDSEVTAMKKLNSARFAPAGWSGQWTPVGEKFDKSIPLKDPLDEIQANYKKILDIVHGLAESWQSGLETQARYIGTLIGTLTKRIQLLEESNSNSNTAQPVLPIHFEVVPSPNNGSVWMIATVKDPQTQGRSYYQVSYYQAHSKAWVVNSDAGSDFADYSIAELVCKELNRRKNHG